MQPVRVTPQSAFNTQSESLVNFLRTQEVKDCLYLHQIEATLAVKKHLDNPNLPNIALVVLPTGSGKTAVAVLSAYATNSSRVLVITPSKRVSLQIQQAFTKLLYERKIADQKQQPPHQLIPSLHLVKKSSDFPDCLSNPLIITNAHKIGGRSNIAIDDIPTDFDLVIVDEAHHYPAATWRLLVDHFPNAKRLFLTATPKWRGSDILVNQQNHICYTMTHQQAVQGGFIRNLQFEVADSKEPVEGDEEEMEQRAFRAIADKIRQVVRQHDQQDSRVFHQAIVLTQTRQGINPADVFKKVYNGDLATDSKERCETFVTGDAYNVVKRYETGEFRTLVVIGRLLEGFDHKNISVAAIARNVKSHVLFGQFVGRAVRKFRSDDPVIAVLISHPRFNQRANYDAFDQVAEVEDEGEEDEDE